MRPLKVAGLGVPDAWLGLSLVGFSGFWAGSGRAGWVLERVLVGSGWVLELKNDNSKIIEMHGEKHCFGFMRLQDGAKMDSKNALFWSVKILRIHYKKAEFWQHERLQKNRQFVKGLLLFKKQVLLQPRVLSQQKLDL